LNIYRQPLRAEVARKHETMKRQAGAAAVISGEAVFTRSTLPLPDSCEHPHIPASRADLVCCVNAVRSTPSLLGAVLVGPAVEVEVEHTMARYGDVWNEPIGGQTSTPPRTRCLTYTTFCPKVGTFVKVYGSWDAFKQHAVEMLFRFRSDPTMKQDKTHDFFEDAVFNAQVTGPCQGYPFPAHGPQADKSCGGLYDYTIDGDEQEEGGSNLLVSDGISSNTCM
jgi:hypothetical protein